MGKSKDTQPVAPPVAWTVPGVPLGQRAELAADIEQRSARFAETIADLDELQRLVWMRQFIDGLEADWLVRCAHAEQAGQTTDDGSPSLPAWLRHRCHLAPGEANSRARVAKGITSGELPETAAAMKSGQISWRHGAVIQATVNDVPQEFRVGAERAMQEPAKELDPTLLRRVGADLLHRLDVEKAEELAVRRLERRGLDIAETFDGMVAVSGLLDPVAGATLLAAVDSKVQPTRGDDAETRTWSQRRADALSDICREWLDLAETPVVGGQRPHLAVRVDLATLRKTVGSGSAKLDWVGPITAEQARLLACDASVSRILTDGATQVLDVGRATRTIPPGIRRAVVARDHTCVAAGCHRAPQHCDVHHIVFWEDGGPTSLDNLVLVCRRHHGFVHQRGWRVSVDDQGQRSLVPPVGRPPPAFSLN